MKGFVVAGTGSGIGKTTVTAALIAALVARRLVTQTFKCGPDYIDPAHHARLTGRPSHNLDSWMMSHESLQAIFDQASGDADVAVVEGVMGLFDGVSGADEVGSTAEIAKLLDLPVILVVDASNAARSVAAVVKGFQVFDAEVKFLGVILNRPAGPTHVALLEQAIAPLGIPVLGWLPTMAQARLEERHLGLVTAGERSWDQAQVEQLAAAAEQYLRIDLLLANAEIARHALSRPVSRPHCRLQPEAVKSGEQARIGIARDLAFSFYYQASLDMLRAQGAELVEVSPLSDAALPEALDALYIGGGYPEIYAEQLSANQPFIASLREFARAGHPVYGECGGLMYLAQELKTGDGCRHPMASVLPLQVEMLDRLENFGYTEVKVIKECPIAPQGASMRGHSFHFSRVTPTGPCTLHYAMHNLLSGKEAHEGYAVGNVFASYIHLTFADRPELARYFVVNALAARTSGARR